jgi:hypothetical protein
MLGGAHTQYERFGLRNIVPPTEFEPQIFQPVADTLYSLNPSPPYRYSTNSFYHNLNLSKPASCEIITACDNPQLDSMQPFTKLNSTKFISVVSDMKHKQTKTHNRQYPCHFTQKIISNSGFLDFVGHPEFHTETGSASVHRLKSGQAKGPIYITGQSINKLRNKKY